MIIDLIHASEVAVGTHPNLTGATVLLVEDDAAIRILVTRLLTLHGYRVLSAETGRAALPIWERRKNEIDLLLTDVVMPYGVSGRELALRCQTDKSSLQVIYTSGYDLELSAEKDWSHDGIHFVQKPYRPEQLLQIIADVLTRSDSKPDPYVADTSR